MSFTGTETIVAQVLDVLQDGLPTALTALNSSYNDGVTLTDVETGSYWAHLMDPRLLESYPAIIVRRGPRERVGEYPAIGGEYAFANQIAVDIVVCDESHAVLTTKMDRYVRAVCELLAAEGSLTVGQCVLERVGYGEPESTDAREGQPLMDVPCFFSVVTYETP